MEDTNYLWRNYAEIKDELGLTLAMSRRIRFRQIVFYCSYFSRLCHFNRYRVDLKIAASPPIFSAANIVPIQGGIILHDHEQVGLDEAPKS